MRPQVPPELDRTMWILAERNDPKAIEEFGNRFPDLRTELVKRLEMVRSLRGMSDGVRPDRIPEFQLRGPEPVAASPRVIGVGLGLIAAALALGTYAVVTNRPLPRSVPVPTPISTELPAPTPGVVYSDNLPNNTPSPQPVRETPVMPTDIPAYAQIQDFFFDHTKLAEAVRMIANAAHLRVEIAPGLPDIEITTSYPQVTPVDALKQLGTDYGFTPFAEEDGHVLILPVRDSTQPSTAPSPSATPTTSPTMKPVQPSSSPSRPR